MKNNEKLTVEIIAFLKWCNTPIYRAAGELGFKMRAMAQFPDYNTYLVIDETGNSVLPEGKFLTAEELFEYWVDTRLAL